MSYIDSLLLFFRKSCLSSSSKLELFFICRNSWSSSSIDEYVQSRFVYLFNLWKRAYHRLATQRTLHNPTLFLINLMCLVCDLREDRPFAIGVFIWIEQLLSSRCTFIWPQLQMLMYHLRQHDAPKCRITCVGISVNLHSTYLLVKLPIYSSQRAREPGNNHIYLAFSTLISSSSEALIVPAILLL